MIIDLGPGKKPKEDADILIDIIKLNNKKTIIHDLNKVPYPFKNESVDKIYAIAVLEHLDISEQEFFKECYRILKYGGQLIINVPNTMFIYHRIKYLLGTIPGNFILSHKKHMQYQQVRNCLRNCGFNVKDNKRDIIPFYGSLINNIKFKVWKY